MASVHDVAACIFAELGGRARITTMMLEKLVYYAQAWSLAWDNKPLFSEPIEAWAEGPVVRKLYEKHRHRRYLTAWPHGSAAALSADQRRTVRQVVKFYGHRQPEWLSALTHRESPWVDARGGSFNIGHSTYQIKNSDMRRFYRSLAKSMGTQRGFTKKYERSLDLLVQLAPDEVASFNEDSGLSHEEVLASLT